MTDWGPLYLAAANLPIMAGLLTLLIRSRASLARSLIMAGLTLSTGLALAGLLLYQQQSAAGKTQLLPTPAWTGSVVWLRLSQLGVEGHGRLGYSPDAPAVELYLGYHVDALATVLFVVVSAITLLTIVAARPRRDAGFAAHASILSGLVLHALLADNLLQLWLCWVLGGLVAARMVPACLRFFLTQHVGDAGLLIGIVILATSTGTLDLVTVREVERDVTGKVITEDGQPKSRIARLSVFDALRTPDKDSHDDPFAEPGATAGQMCRVNLTRTARGKKKLELAEMGALVVVWNQETLNGHFDRPERRRFDAFDPDAAGGHGKGLRTVPYWVVCVAGFGIVLGCFSKAAQFPLNTWVPDAVEGSLPALSLVLTTLPLLGVYLAARVFPVFTAQVLLTTAYIGAITALLGAGMAFRSAGQRRPIAFLSLTQWGLALAGLGVGGWSVAVIHGTLVACATTVLLLGSTAGLGVPKRAIRFLTLLLLVALPVCLIVPNRPGGLAFSGVLTYLWSFVSLEDRQSSLILLPLAALVLAALTLARVGRGILKQEIPSQARGENPDESMLSWPVVVLFCLTCLMIGAEPLVAPSEPAAASEVGPLRLQDVTEQVTNGYFKRDSWLRRLHEAANLGPYGVALGSWLFLLVVAGVLYWLLRSHGFLAPSTTEVPDLFSRDDLGLSRVYYRGLPGVAGGAANALDALDRRFWPGIASGVAAATLVLAGAARFIDDRLIGGVTRGVGWPVRRLWRRGSKDVTTEDSASAATSL